MLSTILGYTHPEKIDLSSYFTQVEHKKHKKSGDCDHYHAKIEIDSMNQIPVISKGVI